jgi:uncharacterized protein YktA (UPF0223 family)
VRKILKEVELYFDKKIECNDLELSYKFFNKTLALLHECCYFSFEEL